jgi:arabinofuranan 3-O-arabinosyltransferase
MRDEPELGTPLDAPNPPPLAVFPVDDAPTIVHAQSAARPLVIAGDGDGTVDAAEAGLLDSDRTVLYSASFANDPAALRAALDRGADLLVTDTNRLRAQRWGTVRENNGYTEQPGSSPLVDDPKDTRLDVFPGAGPDTQTVADYVGVADVEASNYGNIVAYSPERRPANALDGDPRTSWQVGGFADIVGERLRITLDQPVTTDHVTVSQLSGNRFITELGVRLDGTKVTTAALGDPSFADAGQTIDLGGPHTFREIELSIDGSNVEHLPNYVGWSTAGIREVGIPGVHLEEVIRVPTDLLDAASSDLAAHDVTVLLSRWRADPAEPFRADPEPRLVRALDLPSARTFSLRGEARIESRADGATIDDVLGRPGIAAGYPTASGTDFLAGDIDARPSTAIDGDPATAWSPNLGGQIGRNFHVALPNVTTFDHLDLQVGADGWHSVPTQLTFDLDEGGSVSVDLPPVADGADRGHVATVPVTLPRSVSTHGFTVRITGTRDVSSIEYFSGEPGPLPVSIAELGIPGVEAGPLPARLPATCRADLVSVDGTPVPVRVEGTIADAIARLPLSVVPCDAGSLPFDAGRRVVRSADGIDAGIAIDRVLLESPAPAPAAVSSGAVPTLTTSRTGHVGYDVHVSGATDPFWLVLGQSRSDGWHAKVHGRGLGTPVLVDGYANGWLVDPAVTGTDFTVSLEWTPQRIVWAAIAVSALALVALIGAAVALTWRERRVPDHNADRRVAQPAFTLGPGLARPRAPRRRVVLGAVGLALVVVAWAIGGVACGVVVGALTALVLVDRRLRLVGAAFVVSAYPITAAWYVAKQWRNHYPPGVEWPGAFGFTHTLVLTAVLALGALTLLDELASRSADGSFPHRE